MARFSLPGSSRRAGSASSHALALFAGWAAAPLAAAAAALASWLLGLLRSGCLSLRCLVRSKQQHTEFECGSVINGLPAVDRSSAGRSSDIIFLEIRDVSAVVSNDCVSMNRQSIR